MNFMVISVVGLYIYIYVFDWYFHIDAKSFVTAVLVSFLKLLAIHAGRRNSKTIRR